jgi:arabinose-5-phosphate isomerase
MNVDDRLMVQVKDIVDHESLKAIAQEVFEIEAQAVRNLALQLTEDFGEAVKRILECKARIIVSGMGKSGIIGRKISATMASTGTPSFFIHPAEAFHGDLGMLKKEDALLLISYSGETEEVLRIIPFLKENGNLLISMTGNSHSALAKSSDYHLSVSVEKEACPLQMAPTSSTTVALVMGDALAIALMKARGFRAEDFARFHPGGRLGRRLLTRVEDAMIRNNLPVIPRNSSMKEVIHVMTSSRLGVAIVVDDKGKIAGLITDGDLRRALDSEKNIFEKKPEDIMTRNPKIVSKDLLLYEAEKLLTQYEINQLLIADEEHKPRGIFIYHNI